MTMQKTQHIELSSDDALIIIDLQNDFLRGGSLAVSQSDEIVPVINQYIQIFLRQHRPIIATRDWHPFNHCSFKAQGGQWPEHCIADTDGAEFSANLKLPESTIIVSKGTAKDVQGYSGFDHTDLKIQLARNKVRRLFIGGLATDYCVLNTVLDALDYHFQVFLLEDAVRAVNLHRQNGQNAINKMTEKGAILVSLADFQ